MNIGTVRARALDKGIPIQIDGRGFCLIELQRAPG
jgi:hypothetical protein